MSLPRKQLQQQQWLVRMGLQQVCPEEALQAQLDRCNPARYYLGRPYSGLISANLLGALQALMLLLLLLLLLLVRKLVQGRMRGLYQVQLWLQGQWRARRV